MKFPERFWTETIPRLTDVSVAALLHALATAPESLPRGVIRASAGHWAETRYAWAATQIDAELSIAPGITVDPRAELAVVWEVATAELPPGVRPAAGWARRIALTQASFAHELADRLQRPMRGETRSSFQAALAAAGLKVKKTRKVTTLPPRPRADPFEPLLVAIKRYERSLRAELDVEDLGERPSAADRRAIVGVLAAGYDEEFVLDALAGRAEKCRKNPRWRDVDTAESYLRITWLCTDLRRLQEAQRVGAVIKQEPESAVVVGEDGRRYFNGMEIFQTEPAPDPNATLAPFDYDALGPNRWVKRPEPK